MRGIDLAVYGLVLGMVFWPYRRPFGILVPRLSTVKALSPNHGTAQGITIGQYFKDSNLVNAC